MTELLDPGLQAERTELAWRRTALALALGSVVSMRLLPAVLGSAWWALAGVAGFVFAVGVWIAARHRFVVIRARLLVDGDVARLPGAAILTMLAGAIALLGVVAATLILALAAPG